MDSFFYPRHICWILWINILTVIRYLNGKLLCITIGLTYFWTHLKQISNRTISKTKLISQSFSLFWLRWTTSNLNQWETWRFHLSNCQPPFFFSSEIPSALLYYAFISKLIYTARTSSRYPNFINNDACFPRDMILRSKNFRYKYRLLISYFTDCKVLTGCKLTWRMMNILQ